MIILMHTKYFVLKRIYKMFAYFWDKPSYMNKETMKGRLQQIFISSNKFLVNYNLFEHLFYIMDIDVANLQL